MLTLRSIVAVHGIGADPDKTWTAAKGGVNWLTDPRMLPKAVPSARIMRFGYRSSWYGREQEEPRKTFVSDVAQALLKQMEFHRRVCLLPVSTYRFSETNGLRVVLSRSYLLHIATVAWC